MDRSRAWRMKGATEGIHRHRYENTSRQHEAIAILFCFVRRRYCGVSVEAIPSSRLLGKLPLWGSDKSLRPDLRTIQLFFPGNCVFFFFSLLLCSTVNFSFHFQKAASSIFSIHPNPHSLRIVIQYRIAVDH